MLALFRKSAVGGGNIWPQLKLRKYDAEFADAGVTDIVQVALAVQGEEVLMKGSDRKTPKRRTGRRLNP